MRHLSFAIRRRVAGPEPALAEPARPEAASRRARQARPILAGPPTRRRGPVTWLLLAGCLMVAAVPLLVELGAVPAVTPGERQALKQSQRHWAKWQASAPIPGWRALLDRLMPPASGPNGASGEVALTEPPGRSWLHLAAFAGLDQSSGPSARRYRARLVSVAATLVAVAAIYWAGYSIGGAVTALLAGLMTASMPAVILEGRLATATMPITAGSVLAVAAALWAIRPYRPAPTAARQAGGWTLCGLALAAVTVIGGAVSLLPVVVALAVLAALCPRRLGHALGLVAALGGALLLTLPWMVHVLRQTDVGWVSLMGAGLGPGTRLAPSELAQALGWRVFAVVLATLPWTLWLVVGLWPPLGSTGRRTRRRMFLGWSWFVASAVVLVALAPGGVMRAITPMLPLAALVGAQVLRQFVDLSAEGRYARPWQLGRWAQGGAIAIGSVLLPVGLWLQPRLVTTGWLDEALTAPVGWGYAAGMAAALLLLALVGLKLAAGQFPGKATVAWAIWTAVATTLVLIPAARGPALLG